MVLAVGEILIALNGSFQESGEKYYSFSLEGMIARLLDEEIEESVIYYSKLGYDPFSRDAASLIKAAYPEADLVADFSIYNAPIMVDDYLSYMGSSIAHLDKNEVLRACKGKEIDVLLLSASLLSDRDISKVLLEIADVFNGAEIGVYSSLEETTMTNPEVLKNALGKLIKNGRSVTLLGSYQGFKNLDGLKKRGDTKAYISGLTKV